MAGYYALRDLPPAQAASTSHPFARVDNKFLADLVRFVCVSCALLLRCARDVCGRCRTVTIASQSTRWPRFWRVKSRCGGSALAVSCMCLGVLSHCNAGRLIVPRHCCQGESSFKSVTIGVELSRVTRDAVASGGFEQGRRDIRGGIQGIL